MLSSAPVPVLYRTLDTVMVNSDVGGADVVVSNPAAKAELYPLIEALQLEHDGISVRFRTMDYGAASFDNYVCALPSTEDAKSLIESELSLQTEFQPQSADPASRLFKYVRTLKEGTKANLVVIGFRAGQRTLYVTLAIPFTWPAGDTLRLTQIQSPRPRLLSLTLI